MINTARDVYNQTQIETASPEKLVLMLYDGLISRLHQSKRDILNKKLENGHHNLMKAEAILMELTGSLNPMAGDISNNLEKLYFFMMEKLVEANLKKIVSPIEEVIKLITPIRDAWEKAVVRENKILA